MTNTNFDGALNELYHMAFSPSKSNNESYTYRQMPQQEDALDILCDTKAKAEAH